MYPSIPSNEVGVACKLSPETVQEIKAKLRNREPVYMVKLTPHSKHLREAFEEAEQKRLRRALK